MDSPHLAIPNGSARRRTVPPNGKSNGKNGLPLDSKKRVTFVLPTALDHGLEVYCSVAGRLKNEVAAAAISEFLRKSQHDILPLLQAAAKAVSTGS